jgi:hypothetical protein
VIRIAQRLGLCFSGILLLPDQGPNDASCVCAPPQDSRPSVVRCCHTLNPVRRDTTGLELLCSPTPLSWCLFETRGHSTGRRAVGPSPIACVRTRPTDQKAGRLGVGEGRFQNGFNLHRQHQLALGKKVDSGMSNADVAFAFLSAPCASSLGPCLSRIPYD